MSNEIDPQLQELVDSLEDYLDYRGAWSDQKRAWVAEDIQAYAQERVEAREAAIVERLRNKVGYWEHFGSAGIGVITGLNDAIDIVKGGANDHD